MLVASAVGVVCTQATPLSGEYVLLISVLLLLGVLLNTTEHRIIMSKCTTGTVTLYSEFLHPELAVGLMVDVTFVVRSLNPDRG